MAESTGFQMYVPLPALTIGAHGWMRRIAVEANRLNHGQIHAPGLVNTQVAQFRI